MKLSINKNIDFDDAEVAVIAALNGLYSPKHEKLGTSVPIIGLFMTGRILNISLGSDRTIIEKIRKAFKTLSQKGYIEIIQNAGDVYELSNKGLIVNPETETFTMIEHWEMQKIFREAKKPFALLRFFINIVNHINNKTKECHISQDTLIEIYGGSKTTINEYFKKLEELKILYVFRSDMQIADGTFYRLNNFYGRYCDKEAIKEYAEKYNSNLRTSLIFNRIDRRSIKLRYNSFCSNGKKYQDNPQTVSKLYKDCLLYNETIKDNPIINSKFEESGALDLSVFDDVLKVIKEKNKK